MKTNVRLITTTVFLASCCLMLKQATPAANSQRGFVTEEEEGVCFNEWPQPRPQLYCVYLSWTPDDIDKTFDVCIHDSITDRPVEGITYDVMLQRGGQLVSSSKSYDQTTTRQVYDFEQQGQYTLRVDNINGGNDRIDYSIQVTPEFPIRMFFQAWQPRTGLAA